MVAVMPAMAVYLGFFIKPNKIAMDPKKLAGISDWPLPKNLRQV
jgi:hypothetical protein